jgi:hypothetical protein
MTAKGKSFGDVFDAHTAAEFQLRDMIARCRRCFQASRRRDGK